MLEEIMKNVNTLFIAFKYGNMEQITEVVMLFVLYFIVIAFIWYLKKRISRQLFLIAKVVYRFFRFKNRISKS